jgi:uncharacterized iron-regulated protein
MIKLVFLFICSFLVVGCASHKYSWHSPYKDVASLKDGDILHVPTGVLVEKEALVDYLDGMKVIYVGETHDNINAHRMQLKILKALHQRNPGGVAVGMEMLKRSSQDAADQWTAGKLEEKEWIKTWIDDWSNDFQYYQDILFYLRDNRIPLVALRASDRWTEKVKGTANNEGARGVEEDGPLPKMDLEDAYHRSQIEAVFKAHPMGTNNFEDFYQVQVLWDESMAQSIYDYLTDEAGKDKKIIVFAGAQHVEHGFGIPRRLFRRLPVPYAIVVPVTLIDKAERKPKTMGITLPEIPLIPGDFAWVVTHKDLKDEKVYLGVIIDATDAGLKVLRTTKGSVAEGAGIKKDDIIATFDGEKIETSFDLTYLIGKKKPGDRGVVEVSRGTETLRFEVTFKKGRMHM